MTAQAVSGRIVLEPSGDMCEGEECDQMERTLLEHAARGRAVVVDLSRTRLLSARALGILARAQRAAIAKGGRIVVCGANRLQRFLLSATHLTDAIAVVDDVAAAMRLLDRVRPAAA
jgi:anti-anti-sigma factor